jgi:hypothetical protein
MGRLFAFSSSRADVLIIERMLHHGVMVVAIVMSTAWGIPLALGRLAAQWIAGKPSWLCPFWVLLPTGLA